MQKSIQHFSDAKYQRYRDPYANNHTSGSRPQSEAIAWIDKIITQQKKEAAATMRDFEFVTELGSNATFFQSIEYELNQMLSFFETFKQIIEEINEGPCPKLTSKPPTS